MYTEEQFIELESKERRVTEEAILITLPNFGKILTSKKNKEGIEIFPLLMEAKNVL